MEMDHTERLDAYLADELQEDLVRLVETEIRGDQVAQDEFVVQAQMDAALNALMADEQSSHDFAQGVIASVQTAPERSLAKSVLSEILDEREAAALVHQPRTFDWWVWTKTAAIAAVAAAVTVWVLQSVRVGDEKAAPRPTILARLTLDDEAEWADSSLKARNDGWLEAGRLNLKSGLAEVTFGSGARVMLEGPVVFDIEQTNRGFLKRGQLTAEVPGPASGFVINTPTLNVVDLGTRFGLRVKTGGESEIHVMQGVVEVSRARGSSVPLVLTEGLAVAADKRPQSRLKPVTYEGHRFVLPTEQNIASSMDHFLHYGFDESGGAEIDDTGMGLEGGPFDISLLSEADRLTQASPKRTAGVVGRGLAFEQGNRLEAIGPALLAGGKSPWTVMFWTKVPPKAGKNTEREMVTWGSEERSWKVRWNVDGNVGAAGALRVDYGMGHATGATDLRDGRWHHAAVVFVGSGQEDEEGLADSDQADVATHVRLYIDGKLETLSGGKSESVDSIEPGAVNGVSSFSLGGSGSFEGWLDEFYLFETAASPATILELYEQGVLAAGSRADGQGIR